jgi:N-methylhydantoinase B/oxoprolinase/acetone carboxylase alpha subunit
MHGDRVTFLTAGGGGYGDPKTVTARGSSATLPKASCRLKVRRGATERTMSATAACAPEAFCADR